MSGVVVAALITAGPATIAAGAALITSLRVKGDTKKINQAVNNRAPGERTLLQLCSDTNDRITRNERHFDKRLTRFERHLAEHQGWHEGKHFLSMDEVREVIREEFGDLPCKVGG